ncbi:MAG TPA: GDSL-type esterase/lipase family protein [Reyranella sp.]|nr:GDSL-type esterase/lipase family protein [Reyranella sp.]
MSSPALPARRPRDPLLGRLILLVCSVLVTLFLLEIGCRLMRGPEALLDWRNIVLVQRLKMSAQNIGHRFTYDPLLGYVQRDGFSDPLMAFGAHGFRQMPPPPADATAGPPVLATGDSYTQGDEVDNDHTWPAQLQGLLRRRTINAGVAAYGFDQIVLRTEQLVPVVKPGLIVLGFIGDDLRRAEMSRTWGTEKPYFTLNGAAAELHNVPVPPSPDPRDTLDFWQKAVGWSVLLDTVLIHQGRQYEWLVDHRRATPPGTGERLACPLLRRLAALGVPTLVVAQYDFYVWQNAEFAAVQRRVSQAVLKCAEAAGLASLDLYDRTEQAVRTRGLETMYLTWHPSAEGYRLIAEAIAAELERRRMVPMR